MTLLALTYVALGFGALSALCVMILRIGTMLGTCPDTGAAARAAAVTITTGFAAIGAVLPIMQDAPMVGFLAALGFASLCLGLGFTHAIATLRAVILDRQAQRPETATADLPDTADALAVPAT